jgi:hypothetical protein
VQRRAEVFDQALVRCRPREQLDEHRLVERHAIVGRDVIGG